MCWLLYLSCSQACYEPRKIEIVNGYATIVKKPIRKKLQDGTNVGIIPSLRRNKKYLQMFYEQLYNICPIYHIADHTLCKNASQTLKAYLYYLINNKTGQGYCPFHHTKIPRQDSKPRKTTHQLERQMGIPKNDHFVWYPKCIPVNFAGDAGPVSNVTRWIHHLVIMILQILGLGMSISQSVICGACVMVSTLSESDNQLTPIIQQIGDTLTEKGCLAIKAEAENTWICLNFKKFNIGDWKFSFTHLNLSVGVTAPFSLVELCWWKNGVPFGVHQDDYYECLLLDYIVPSTAPSFEQCIAEKFTGLILSDKKVLQYWGTQTDTIVGEWQEEDDQNGILDEWDDDKYEREQRVHIAQYETEHGHGILRAMNKAADPALTDPAHSWWSFMCM